VPKVLWKTYGTAGLTWSNHRKNRLIKFKKTKVKIGVTQAEICLRECCRRHCDADKYLTARPCFFPATIGGGSIYKVGGPDVERRRCQRDGGRSDRRGSDTFSTFHLEIVNFVYFEGHFHKFVFPGQTESYWQKLWARLTCSLTVQSLLHAALR